MRQPVYQVQRRKRKSRLGIFLLWLMGTVCLAVVLCVLATPWILRHGVPELFARHGVQASVEDGRLELIRREIVLEGLKLGAADAPALAFDEVGLEFDLVSLLRGRAKLEGLRVQGVVLAPERLASLTTRGPGAVALSPSALGQDLPVEIGVLDFENLRLPFVAERIGHEVLVERIHVVDLDALARDGTANVALEAAIGGAPLKVRAELTYRNDELGLSGVYRLDGVPVRGWLRLLGEEVDPVRGGTLNGTGELRVDYGLKSSTLASTLDGRLSWTGMGVALAGFDAREGDLEWQGRLGLQWQSPAGAPTIRGEGALQAERVRARVAAGSGEQTEARLDDVSWHGTFEWRDGFTADGGVLGTGLEVSATGGPGPSWQGRAEDFSWRLHAVRTASPLTLSVRAQDFDMSRGSFSRAGGEVSEQVTLEGIAVDELRAAHTGDFVLGRMDVEALQVAQGPGPAGVDGTIRVVSGVRAEGLSGELSGTVQIARLGASSFDQEGVARGLHAEEIDAASVGFSAAGTLGAESLSAKSLRIDAEDGAVWLSELAVSRLHRDASAAFGAGSVSVAQIFHGGEKNGSWEAAKLRAAGLRGAPGGAISLDSASLASLLQSGAEVSWRSTGMEAEKLSVSMGTGVEASRLRVETLERRQPEKGDLKVSGLDTSHLSATPDAVELDQGEARVVSYRLPNGDRFEGRELRARGLRGELATGIEVEQLTVAAGHGLALDGTQREAVGLEARALSVDADGSLRLGRGQLIGYHQEGDGIARLGLELLEVLRLSWRPGGELVADAAELHGISVDVDETKAWKLTEIATEAFRWNGARELSAGSARVGSLWRRGPDFPTVLAEIVEAADLSWHIPGELQVSTLAAGALRDAADPPAWGALRLAADGFRLSRLAGYGVDALQADLLTVARGNGELAFSAAHCRARGLEGGAGQGIEAQRLALAEVDLAYSGAESASRLSAGSLVFDSPALHPSGLLDLGHVVAAEPSLVLGQNPDNTWLMLPLPDAPDDTPVRGIRLASLISSGPGRVEFFDRGTDPEFHYVLEPVVLALGELDTSIPGQGTEFRLRGRHGEFAEVSAGGTFTKRVHGFDLGMKVELFGADVSTFNPYLRRRHGLEATAGRGDGLFDLSIDNGELEGNVKLLLAGMEFRRVKSTPEGSRTDTSLPLDVALALIKDQRGNVEIAFPIAARVDAPGFDLLDTTGEGYIRTVYAAAKVAANLPGKTIQGATSVVQRTRSLLPALGSPRYAPVEFSAGSDALSADPMVYLKQLARRMRADDTLEVRPCGVAVPADRAMAGIDDSLTGQRLREAGRGVFPVFGPDDEDQLALAARRARVVGEFLRDVNGVPAAQLADCSPDMDDDDAARPRVELDVVSPGARLRLLPRPFDDLLP